MSIDKDVNVSASINVDKSEDNYVFKWQCNDEEGDIECPFVEKGDKQNSKTNSVKAGEMTPGKKHDIKLSIIDRSTGEEVTSCSKVVETVDYET